MRKFLFLLIVATLFFSACDSSKTTPTNDEDGANSVSDSDNSDSGDSADSATDDDSGDTGNSGTDNDSGNTADSVTDDDTGNTADSVMDDDAGNTADSVIDDDAGNTADSVTDDDAGDTGGGLAVRVIAGNITSGKYQSYDAFYDGVHYDEGIRIFKALKGDIMLVQEFNYGSNTPTSYQSMADEVCPVATCHYSVDSPSFDIPNGIISRWPITSSGWWDDPTLSNRELAWAVIDIPGAKDILAVSVHLKYGEAARQIGAAQVVAEEVDAHRTANPNGYYYVVGGDFNGPSAVSNSGFGQWDGSDVFYVTGDDPVGEDGKEGTNSSRSSQYDFVLADHPLQAFQVGVVYHSITDSDTMTYPDGLVFDTRNFSQSELDEFFPGTNTDDSGASSMQHMAIVKDFYIH